MFLTKILLFGIVVAGAFQISNSESEVVKEKACPVPQTFVALPDNCKYVLKMKNGTCDPNPKMICKCPENEVYKECGSPCEPTCDAPDLPKLCRAMCKPGCFCKEKFYKNDDGDCVPRASCKNKTKIGPCGQEKVALKGKDEKEFDCRSSGSCPGSSHICIPGLGICCPKDEEEKDMSMTIEAECPSDLKTKPGKKLSDVFSTSLKIKSKKTIPASNDEVKPKFLTISVEPAMDMDVDVDIADDVEAYVALSCRPPTLRTCVLDGGIIDMSSEMASGSKKIIDTDDVKLKCSDGRPVPKGKVTLVINADPLHLQHRDCVVKTCDFNIEYDTTEEEPENTCEAFPDLHTMGLNGYIYKQSANDESDLIKFDSISTDNPMYKKVASFEEEVMLAKVKLLTSYFKAKVAGSSICSKDDDGEDLAADDDDDEPDDDENDEVVKALDTGSTTVDLRDTKAAVQPELPNGPKPAVQPELPNGPKPSVQPELPNSPKPSIHPELPNSPKPSIHPELPNSPKPAVQPGVPDSADKKVIRPKRSASGIAASVPSGKANKPELHDLGNLMPAIADLVPSDIADTIMDPQLPDPGKGLKIPGPQPIPSDVQPPHIMTTIDVKKGVDWNIKYVNWTWNPKQNLSGHGNKTGKWSWNMKPKLFKRFQTFSRFLMNVPGCLESQPLEMYDIFTDMDCHFQKGLQKISLQKFYRGYWQTKHKQMKKRVMKKLEGNKYGQRDRFWKKKKGPKVQKEDTDDDDEKGLGAVSKEDLCVHRLVSKAMRQHVLSQGSPLGPKKYEERLGRQIRRASEVGSVIFNMVKNGHGNKGIDFMEKIGSDKRNWAHGGMPHWVKKTLSMVKQSVGRGDGHVDGTRINHGWNALKEKFAGHTDSDSNDDWKEMLNDKLEGMGEHIVGTLSKLKSIDIRDIGKRLDNVKEMFGNAWNLLEKDEELSKTKQATLVKYISTMDSNDTTWLIDLLEEAQGWGKNVTEADVEKWATDEIAIVSEDGDNSTKAAMMMIKTIANATDEDLLWINETVFDYKEWREENPGERGRLWVTGMMAELYEDTYTALISDEELDDDDEEDDDDDDDDDVDDDHTREKRSTSWLKQRKQKIKQALARLSSKVRKSTKKPKPSSGGSSPSTDESETGSAPEKPVSQDAKGSSGNKKSPPENGQVAQTDRNMGSTNTDGSDSSEDKEATSGTANAGSKEEKAVSEGPKQKARRRKTNSTKGKSGKDRKPNSRRRKTNYKKGENGKDRSRNIKVSPFNVDINVPEFVPKELENWEETNEQKIFNGKVWNKKREWFRRYGKGIQSYVYKNVINDVAYCSKNKVKKLRDLVVSDKSSKKDREDCEFSQIQPQFFWKVHNGAVYQGFLSKLKKKFVWRKRAVCGCSQCHSKVNKRQVPWFLKQMLHGEMENEHDFGWGKDRSYGFGSRNGNGNGHGWEFGKSGGGNSWGVGWNHGISMGNGWGSQGKGYHGMGLGNAAFGDGLTVVMIEKINKLLDMVLADDEVSASTKKKIKDLQEKLEDEETDLMELLMKARKDKDLQALAPKVMQLWMKTNELYWPKQEGGKRGEGGRHKGSGNHTKNGTEGGGNGRVGFHRGLLSDRMIKKINKIFDTLIADNKIDASVKVKLEKLKAKFNDEKSDLLKLFTEVQKDTDFHALIPKVAPLVMKAKMGMRRKRLKQSKTGSAAAGHRSA